MSTMSEAQAARRGKEQRRQERDAAAIYVAEARKRIIHAWSAIEELAKSNDRKYRAYVLGNGRSAIFEVLSNLQQAAQQLEPIPAAIGHEMPPNVIPLRARRGDTR